MAQELVGYQLLDTSNTVIQSWGGVWGQVTGIPDMITLPNGDQVHCPQVNVSYSGYTLMPWNMSPPILTATDYDLQPYQFFAMIAIANLTATITTSISNISDPTQKIIAQSKLDHTLSFKRSDPFIDQLSASANLTSAQVDAYWLRAKDL